MRLLLIILFTFNALAGLKKYVVNDQHSYINFEISFMGISKVKGTFPKIRANFEFDEESQQFGRVLAKVNVAKISTGDSRRDRHLRSKDFFFVSKYPHFIFESTKVDYDKDGKPVKIHGKVNIKGIVKPVSWRISYRGKKVDKKGFESLFFIVEGSISRKDFNLNWNKVLDKGEYIIGDEVSFEMVLESHPFGKVPQFSRFFALNKEERKRSKQELQNQNPLLTSIEANSVLQKEIQRTKEVISSKDRMISFLKDEVERVKFEKKQLQKTIDKLKDPGLPWWKRILILLGTAIACGIVIYFVVKNKIKTDDGDIFDYLKPTKTRKNAVLDGVFVFSIFCFAWVIFKYLVV